jgi:hypothetical protein
MLSRLICHSEPFKFVIVSIASNKGWQFRPKQASLKASLPQPPHPNSVIPNRSEESGYPLAGPGGVTTKWTLASAPISHPKARQVITFALTNGPRFLDFARNDIKESLSMALGERGSLSMTNLRPALFACFLWNDIGWKGVAINDDGKGRLQMSESSYSY